MRYTKCCQCGCVLVCDTRKPDTALSLCAGCWRPMPGPVIVERSKAHDVNGHAACRAYTKPDGL